MRISKNWTGKKVFFEGFDGVTYKALVVSIQHGFMQIQYIAPSVDGYIHAYLDLQIPQCRKRIALAGENAL